MKILILDNYDSFTYNLMHYLERATDAAIEVHRNDQIGPGDVAKFDKVLLSPGPGVPSTAGIMQQVIRQYAGSKPIFGVCLGLQAIAEVFGGELINLEKVYHGIATPVSLDNNDPLFAGLPPVINAGRYHSWAVNRHRLPACLKITAEDAAGNIMALRHRDLEVCGVQFHPESILTDNGLEIIANWVNN